jgi:hypothetical protein
MERKKGPLEDGEVAQQRAEAIAWGAAQEYALSHGIELKGIQYGTRPADKADGPYSFNGSLGGEPCSVHVDIKADEVVVIHHRTQVKKGLRADPR